MGDKDKHQILIQIPPCSSNYQISKDIFTFLNKRGNNIPISFTNNMLSGGGIFDYFKPKTPESITTTSNTTKNNPPTPTPTPIPSHEESNENLLVLEFQNKTYNIDNIKGTKLYYLFLRNGECARWI